MRSSTPSWQPISPTARPGSTRDWARFTSKAANLTTRSTATPTGGCRGLQAAIRKGHLTSFDALCHTTDTEFYEKDRGTNYAQARYLCYYLQQKGLLKSYYRRFLASRKDDPSGYKTLKAVLERDDMAAFQEQWESYVLKLKYPNRD